VKGELTHFQGDPAMVTHHRMVRESNRAVWTRVGLSTAQCSGQCHLGHYCPPGAFHPQQMRCPAGRYGARRGLTNDACAAGANDCDIASSTISATAAAGQEAASTTSSPGHGEGTGLESDIASTGTSRVGFCKPSICPAGYYCPAGTRSPIENPCGEGRYEEVYVQSFSQPDEWEFDSAVDPHPELSDEYALHATDGVQYGDARRSWREGSSAVPQRDWEAGNGNSATTGSEAGANTGRYIYAGGDDLSTTMYPYTEHGGIASGRIISPRAPSHPTRLASGARRLKMAPELQLLYGWGAKHYCPPGSALPSVVSAG
jgi:hypothetical protein